MPSSGLVQSVMPRAAEDLAVHVGGGDHPGERVVVDVIADHRAGVAQRIEVARIDGDAVGRRGQLLDRQREANVARKSRRQLIAQLRPEQVLLVDRVRHGGVGRSGRRSPAVVADVEAECGVRGPERPSSQIIDTGRRQRPTVGPDGGRHQSPRVQGRMVHQVLSQHAAPAAEPGGQHQLGVFDGVRGQHVRAALRRWTVCRGESGSS